METSLQSISELLQQNSYPGRGIIIGKSADGKNAIFAYFIMGRSENSRNRIFVKTEDGIQTEAHDASKMTDPSLIIYSPVRTFGDKIIVTNGDQTDTIYEHLESGKSFESALSTRSFEPDEPNFTPRISGILDFESGYTYKLSILKSADSAGHFCSRYFYNYEPQNGTAHFIHTYRCDGSPIPSFNGDPHTVAVSSDIDECANQIWSNLNEDNKVSLYVCFRAISSGKIQTRIINKNA